MTQVVLQASGQPPQSVKAYSNATKLFRLGSHNIAVATFGIGNIDHRSVGGIVLDFADTLQAPVQPSMQDVAEGLANFAGALYDRSFSAVPLEQRPVLGFLVGGHSANNPLAEVWDIRFPTLPGTPSRSAQLRKPDEFGANWRGIELPFSRLHFGVDPRLLETVVGLGVDAATATAALGKFQSPVVFDSMPIQDTIDFAKYILSTTISFSTFEIGVPACGGPHQIAVILHRKGFEWVEEPRFHV
ncbi:MAG TPA: hypothetical protein VJR24_07905 [Gemmatimonadaceae bacterium]|nr:hypothetical protein [Gemmatimonadaceae bacterium]